MRAALAVLCLSATAACGGKSRRDVELPEPARLIAIEEQAGTLASTWSALSDDGSRAVGTLSIERPGSVVELVPVTWTFSAGVEILTPAPVRESSLMDVDASGDNIGGTTNAFGSYQPFVWSRGEISYIPYNGSLDAMSADTRFVVGRFLDRPDFIHAYLWSEPTGRIDLGTLEGEGHSSAEGVSDDGQVVIGSSGETAFLWTDADGLQALPLPPQKTRSRALDLSRDGRVIAGWSGTFDSADSNITLWGDDGVEEVQGLPGQGGGEARAVSADGSILVGKSGDEAFIWTRATGTRAISALLLDAGVDLAAWQLSEALDVSADGSVVLGRGSYEDTATWWVARLPAD
jgi:uncharacterized membrane protein